MNKKLINSLQIIIKKGQYPSVSLINGNNWAQLNNFTINIIGCLICDNHEMFSCDCVWHTKIKNKTYLDLHEIGDFQNLIHKETVIMVMKKLLKTAYYYRKIVILMIKGVECLTAAAATCLLKFLEEVKATLYCFLLTTNRFKVWPTITSRSIIIDLKDNNQLCHIALLKVWTNWLMQINKKQNRKRVMKTIDLMELNRYEIKEFIFNFFSYLKINFPNLLSARLVKTTLVCWERLDLPQLSKRIIICKWVNAVNYLGSS